MIIFIQAEDGMRYIGVTGVQTCALPISMYAATALRPCSSRIFGRRSAMTVNASSQVAPWWRPSGPLTIGVRGWVGSEREGVALGRGVNLGGRRIIKKINCRRILYNKFAV